MILISEYFDAFAVILLITLFLCRMWPWIYRNTFGPCLFGQKIRLADYDRWAVVTNATSELGTAYAFHLAKLGLDVVIIDADNVELELLASDIIATFSVEVKTIVVNFMDGPKIYDPIAEELEDLKIGVLVNNACASYENPEYFHEIRDGRTIFKQLIHCNMESVINMSYIVLPKMIKHQKGVILNIGTVFANAPSPLFAADGASKAFVHKFSEDLATECEAHGIIVQSVLPARIGSDVCEANRQGLFKPSPERYVESAMRNIGYGTYTYGYWPHALIHLLLHEANFYSTSISLWIMRNIFHKIYSIENRRYSARKSIDISECIRF